MSENFSADLITLVDDEGIEREFEILDYIEKNFKSVIDNCTDSVIII